MGCDIHEMVETRDQHGFWHNAGELGLGRSYELFSVLAGVRNDRNIKPVAPPRGVPEDASSPFKAWSNSWGVDGHSHSWLTLAEMKAFDHTQEIEDGHLILSRDENGKITSTCASTNGKHFGPVGKRQVFGLWGKDEWTEILASMEKKKRDDGSDDDIRICFFFDN